MKRTVISALAFAAVFASAATAGASPSLKLCPSPAPKSFYVAVEVQSGSCALADAVAKASDHYDAEQPFKVDGRTWHHAAQQQQNQHSLIDYRSGKIDVYVLTPPVQ